MLPTMDYAIEAEGLRKRFGDTQALDGVDLAARRGTVLGVLGPNGAGKTTAVRILATLLRPDGGHGARRRLRRRPRAAAVRQTIGLTGQYASVDETLTGTQNLVMIGRLLDLAGASAKARAKELLEWFDLTDAADRPARTYSGGMRRRLDLAASLVGRPAVVFLDEPTTGLDPAKRDDMWGVVRTLVDDGRDGPAHHAVPRGGRRARRRDHGHRPRPRDRRTTRPDGAQARSSAARRSTVRPADPARLVDVARDPAARSSGAPVDVARQRRAQRARRRRRGALATLSRRLAARGHRA